MSNMGSKGHEASNPVSGQLPENFEVEVEGPKLDDIEMDALDYDVSIVVPCMSEGPTPSPGPQPSESFYDPDLLPAPTFILSALSVTPIPRQFKFKLLTLSYSMLLETFLGN